MDPQPPVQQPTENNQPAQPVETEQQIAQPTAAPQPPAQVPVYPTANSGMAASTNQSSGSMSTKLFSQGSSHSTLALILGGVSIGVVLLLIFVPSLLRSMGMVAVWLIFVAALSGAAMFFGVKSQKSSDNVDTMAIVAIALSTVMLINCLIIGSYYIKVQITLHNLRSKYKNSGSVFDNY